MSRPSNRPRESTSRSTHRLPRSIQARVEAALTDWQAHGKMRRLWERDASLWSDTDEGDWLGWLSVITDQRARVDQFRALAGEVRAEGFAHALVLGMGGSSLCPEVLGTTFGRVAGYPELLVLDSTDPAQVTAFENKIDPARTLFIVSSKSGSTLEPNIFKQYFFHRVSEALGSEKAGSRFVAITDPGSKLEAIAAAGRFRHVFPGVHSIGGRYSALSDFGMIPAAVIGIDVSRFLERADAMVEACRPSVPAAENPGVVLGAILGACGLEGRDKVTFIASSRVASLGAWLEQLIAESTGKNGKALIPVHGESPGDPECYGNDRLFVYLRFSPAPDASQDTVVARLEEAGHPIVRLEIADPYDLGQEFYRWEIATAVAGSILGINPFDQPDVEASKLATQELTSQFEQSGALPQETPILEGEGLKLFTDGRNAKELTGAPSGAPSVAGCLGAHLRRLSPGDYFGLLAYVERHERHDHLLQSIRHAVRDRKRVATCLGYGPRFLHSTGQAYKGGPNSGVFLQITCEDRDDLQVPDRTYTFGVVKAAQARGDFQVLAERDRRALRIHLGPDTSAGLKRLRDLVAAALEG